MKNIQLDITKATQFLQADAIAAYEPKVKAAQEALENGTCPGNDFLGWLHLPSSITPDFIGELNATAQVLRENCEVVVVAGIGGSYLGARTVIEALSNSFQWLLNDKKNPVILVVGIVYHAVGMLGESLLAGEVREHHHAVVSAILCNSVSEWRHLVGEVHHLRCTQ